MALDYAPLIHRDREDYGLTATFRFTHDPKQRGATTLFNPHSGAQMEDRELYVLRRWGV
jgi:hypothetical protein